MGSMTMGGRTWMQLCVRLVQERVPGVSRRDAETCAEEMLRSWPQLSPEDAVLRYFDSPRFEQTDWSIFELK